jgi:hypothetical protein
MLPGRCRNEQILFGYSLPCTIYLSPRRGRGRGRGGQGTELLLRSVTMCYPVFTDVLASRSEHNANIPYVPASSGISCLRMNLKL